MSLLDQVIANYQQLVQEWNKPNHDLKKCGALLGQLKVALTGLTFLPTNVASTSKKELLVARDVLEIGAQYSIEMKDIPSFERYMAQLKCYYFDYKNELPESAYKYQLLGLNLICFLAQNRVAEFHTELELLPATDIQKNPYISHPVSIEQFLMEGSYNNVFRGKGNVPAPSYTFFMDMLLDTVRDEIASCVERAYSRTSAADISRMLYLDTPQMLAAYAKKRGWQAEGNYFVFTKTDTTPKEEHVPGHHFATQIIEYARQLEMIV